MAPVTNLFDAYDVLDPQPIDFATQAHYYVEPPPKVHDYQTRSPGPIDKIKRALRTTIPTKVFLAGHVGAGKSTQLRKLVTEPFITEKFFVVSIQLETSELPFLDTPQLLFHIARELYERAKSLQINDLDKTVKKYLTVIDRQLFGPDGLSVEAGTTSLEINAWFIKLRQDLKGSERARRQLRDFGETQRTVLQDLLSDLTVRIEMELLQANKPSSLLVVIDDLDKIRSEEQQKELFQVNLGALLSHRFRAIVTLPTAVSFDPSRRELLQTVEHLYPERVLQKAGQSFDPMKAFVDDSLGFFQDLLYKRVDRSLFVDDAVKWAVAYSGGVVRDYFRLLKEAAAIAEQLGQPTVDVAAMKSAIREQRLNWTRTLDHEDYLALLTVHQTHDRADSDRHRRLLDLGLILECYNDETWYEAHPILWASLEKRSHQSDS
ncbi:MAG: hypothetical protein IPK82_36365 [Polyangiaceae bacterium]|nr:hypothetical protein [Polyangiaceae bacterium]